MEKKVTVEEAFEELSEIVEKMDSADVSLEESMELYKQGIKLLEHCGRKLDDIEKEMIVLTEEGDIPDGN